MKTRKILVAAAATTLFSVVFGGLTCGWLFNWVYKLEPANIWKSMDSPPGLWFFIGGFALNALFALVYSVVSKGIPAENKLAKGMIFGLGVWLVGILPGMFSTYAFMIVSPVVVVYWSLLSLVESPLKGLITAAILK